jgi:hypothetical protein
VSPVRVQRKRTKGWRMPEGAVYVGRGSKWGNPYKVASGDSSAAVQDFKSMLDRAPLDAKGETIFTTIRETLSGKDLACWCPLDKPCHADVLLELANGVAS